MQTSIQVIGSSIFTHLPVCPKETEVILLNPKIEKLGKEIKKTKVKITELQNRLRNLEEQKTELENTDYVAVARSFHLTPQQLADFLKAQQSSTGVAALPQEMENSYEE